MLIELVALYCVHWDTVRSCEQQAWTAHCSSRTAPRKICQSSHYFYLLVHRLRLAVGAFNGSEGPDSGSLAITAALPVLTHAQLLPGGTED